MLRNAGGYSNNKPPTLILLVTAFNLKGMPVEGTPRRSVAQGEAMVLVPVRNGYTRAAE